MVKLIKYGLLVLFFLAAGSDLAGYFQFQPDQIFPEKFATSVYGNQIFAYQTIEFKGYFLNCKGEPDLEYVNYPASLITVKQASLDVQIIYPKNQMYSGYVVKSYFNATCNLGLVSIDPGMSFHFFSNKFYGQSYVVESRIMNDYEFVDKLKSFSKDFQYK